MEMAVTTPPARRRAPGRRALKRQRILCRMREGWAFEEIARAEKVTVERVRKIVAGILAKREIDDASDHARIQLARLEAALQAAGQAVANGDIKAIGPYLRVLERLDRYRGLAAVRQMEGNEAREKLLAKLNHMASVADEENFEKRRAARLAEALADSSIGEADGYQSDEARVFLENNGASL
jgi:hypothetical protein